MNKIETIQSLVNELNQYRHEYYNLNKPSVLDLVYDAKFDELTKLEKETGLILSNSPSQTVGYEVISKLQKRTHPTALKSLDKTKSIDELNKWRNGKDIILMLKADGLTVELVYENGQFIGGYTRGNGEIGEDISHNCRVFKNVPLTIPFKGKLRVSGEAIIHWNDFNEINKNLTEDEKYATPRNLVSGSVRQLENKICAERNVHFYVFNILECSEKLSDSKHYNFTWLWEQGFWTIFSLKLLGSATKIDIECITNYAKEINIPIDGLVASYDSVNYSNSLSETSHHPLHSIAYKFSDETEDSILRSVEWNTTRSSQINPTAIFDTVILDNTEVSRASLFNLTFIEELGLNIGSRIKVSKRNMIIPYIEENLDRDLGLLEFPNECPTCGGRTEIKNTGTADYLFCTNDNCSAKLLDKFVHFVKRDCMNIDGLSEATLEKFINKGWLKYFSDIFKLEQYKDTIISMDGFGLKSYNKLIEAIDKSKKVKMENFLFALGISQIGKSASKTIAKYFNGNWDAFEKALIENFDFTQLEDFGQTTNQNLYNWYDNFSERHMWTELTYVVDFVKEEKKSTGFKDLTGLTFVVTGSVTTFKNRDEVGELIISLGGKLSGSVSAKSNYLINNDTTSTSGKNQKAKELNVSIISEQQFNEMIGRIA